MILPTTISGYNVKKTSWFDRFSPDKLPAKVWRTIANLTREELTQNVIYPFHPGPMEYASLEFHDRLYLDHYGNGAIGVSYGNWTDGTTNTLLWLKPQ